MALSPHGERANTYLSTWNLDGEGILHTAIHQGDLPIQHFQLIGVMADIERGSPISTSHLRDQGGDLGGIMLIQGGSGFVDKQQPRVMHERTGQVHPGLLTTGKRTGRARCHIKQADSVEKLLGFGHVHLPLDLVRRPDPAQTGDQNQLVENTQGGQQIGLLEHDADVFPADLSASLGGDITGEVDGTPAGVEDGPAGISIL